MNIILTKGHGSGNDFLIIDEITNGYSFSENDRSALAKLLCYRQGELGADGILYVMNSDHADGRMRVFNADGSEASMCGNGLRLVARYVCELKGLDEAVIETMKANLKVSRKPEIYDGVPTYQVEISPVLFELSALPLNLDQPTLLNEKIEELSDDLRFTALAVPNPHLVAIVTGGQLEGNLQKELSEKVNGPNVLFPDGVNVSFVKQLGSGNIYVRTFERGVGFTNACGTAMSASSLVTCLQGLNEFETSIQVYNNGGKVQCIVHRQEDKYQIDLIGNATYLYNAAVNVDLSGGTFTVSHQEELTEQHTYEKLQAEVQGFLNTAIKG
ncbi:MULTISPECIES: diaminopimelate epimerase [Neobacillus]|uniref:Diaminopimelate epimerase n=1 Tax=Neobacillus rhizophilus TaxID=2833579 RepID=A0A942UC72_9BACI|nr:MULTISPECIES: diaminopimelate epimerase [Neobacillus]MBS4216018.1 diaminopimelate epimerase [Neobacillus rhizophilus]MBU8916085.1 diaminopimelate epimerase [Bacillus sp. FJAT-29953]